jgi:hypothetical protein
LYCGRWAQEGTKGKCDVEEGCFAGIWKDLVKTRKVKEEKEAFIRWLGNLESQLKKSSSKSIELEEKLLSMVIGIDHMKEEHVMVVLAKESLAAEKLEELTIVSQSHTNTQNELKDVEKEKKKVNAKLYIRRSLYPR